MKLIHSKLRFFAFCCYLLFTGTDSRADDATGWLHLTGGDYLAGSLELGSLEKGQGETANRLVWRNHQFADAFQFDFSRLSSITLNHTQATAADGAVMVKTHRGDHLVGTLLDADEETIRIRTQSIGDVTLRQSQLSYLVRLDDEFGLPYIGPMDIKNWSSQGAITDWLGTAGKFSTSTKGASLIRENILYKQSEIELELSIGTSSDFVVAIGANKNDTDDSSKTSAFRIEIWDKQLVIVREIDEKADVISLGKLSDVGNRLRLRIQLDADEGRLTAAVVPSNPLEPKMKEASIELAADKGSSTLGTGIAVFNISGTVGIESIRVTPLLPPSNDTSEFYSDPEDDEFSLTDGSLVRGRITEIRDGDWVISESETEHLTKPDDVVSIRFADRQPDEDSDIDSGEISSEIADDESDDTPPSSRRSLLRLTTRWGSQWMGYWAEPLPSEPSPQKADSICLQTELFDKAIALSTKDLIRIDAPEAAGSVERSKKFRTGTLQLATGRLTAWMVPTASGHRPTSIRIGTPQCTPVTLKQTFAGQLTYRVPPPKIKPKKPPVNQQGRRVRIQPAQPKGLGAQLMNGFARAFGNNKENQAVKPLAMHLQTGEIIPSVIESINASGVTFESSVTDQTIIPEHQLLAVRLTTKLDSPQLSEHQQERLLTVPRVGKKNPPTHLIVANNGDVLRCRLIRMDDKLLQVELRLETVEIERSLVSQIIWLQPQKTVPDETKISVPQEAAPVVRAIMRDGNQLSTLTTSVTGGEIIGKHPFLGDTKININSADVLIIGSYASSYDAEQPFKKWRLTDAPEPVIAESQGGSSGMESALVGKTAPDFRLDLLGGDSFRISKNKGKVLVLDFWASWCGPCLQAMPVIEETVSEFDKAKVMLIAVNLQETKETIQKTLDRLGVSPIVAMDIDGVAAARYQADAIPQTVLIDQDGNVAKVFVGASESLQEKLRTGIEELLQ